MAASLSSPHLLTPTHHALAIPRKASALLSGAALVLADVVSVLAAIGTAILLWRLEVRDVALRNFFLIGPTVGCYLTIFALSGLYSRIAINPVEELRKVIQASTVVCLLLTAASFFAKYVNVYSRGVVLCTWLLSLITIPAVRSLLRRAASTWDWFGVPAIVVGSGRRAEDVLNRLREQPELGLRPALCVTDSYSATGHCAGVRIAGSIALAPHFGRLMGIKHAIVALTESEQVEFMRLLEQQRAPFTHLTIIPNLQSVGSLWVTPRDLNGILGLEVRQNLLVPHNRALKRATDLLVASIAGIFALPLIAIGALLVKRYSKGPAFYHQVRAGLNGRPVRIWKLRTMVPGAEAILQEYLAGNQDARREWDRTCKLKDDPRIIPYIGRLLRRTSIDELPQLWNVLRGDISLVGPRPFPEYHLDRFEEDFRVLRSQVTPGLTGLWQISCRSNSDFTLQERQDTYYIRNWSLWLDFYILSRTAGAVITGTGAH